MLKENCNIFPNKAHFIEKMNNRFQKETPVQYATHQLWCHCCSTILLLVIFRTVAQWPLTIKSCSRDHPPQLNLYSLPFQKSPAGAASHVDWELDRDTQPMPQEMVRDAHPCRVSLPCQNSRALQGVADTQSLI